MKKDIENILRRNGFVQQDNVWVLTRTGHQQIIINGRVSNINLTEKIRFEYLGEGAIDDAPMHGYNLQIKADRLCEDGQVRPQQADLGDFWCTCTEDFKFYFHLS